MALTTTCEAGHEVEVERTHLAVYEGRCAVDGEWVTIDLGDDDE